jgi:hypothetical protein
MIWIRRVLTSISVILLISTGLLWIRGLNAKDTLSIGSRFGFMMVVSYPHHLVIMEDPGAVFPWHSAQLGLPPVPTRSKYLEFHARFEGGTWTVWLPHWLLMLFFSLMPVQAWMTRWRDKRRKQRGLCATCGYDLRGSIDRCPECGLSIPVIGTSPIS